MFFWLKKLKNDIKIALKPAGIEVQANPIMIYHAVYISEKKNMWHCSWVNVFLVALF